jgi:SAM-dependent methyltransferase
MSSDLGHRARIVDAPAVPYGADRRAAAPGRGEERGMRGDGRYEEDVRQLAAEAFDLAGRLCGSCKTESVHRLWPYLRLVGASAEAGAALIHSVLSRLLAEGGRKILIAGCADSGLLAAVARAAHADTEIIVSDRCPTPLELCRRFAVRWSLPTEIAQLDLTELMAQSRFDVVFVHNLLQFIPPTRHLDVLSRMRRSMRPGGRLVIVFRTSTRVDTNLATEYVDSHAARLIEHLESLRIPLPAPQDIFRRHAERFFEERRAREGAHVDCKGVEDLIATAGFEMEEVTPFEVERSESFRQLAAKVGKQRFLAVARLRDGV